MLKILIVEDDTLLARMYQKKLETDGFEVSVAADGKEGLSEAKGNCPDLILLDILMPEMNGFEMLEKMKDQDKLKRIPVIILTNLGGNQEDIDKGLELGAVAYLIKSQVVPSDVVAKVKEVLSATSKKEMPKPVKT